MGARFAYKVKALGREYPSEVEVTNFVENEGWIYTSTKGIECKHQYIFSPLDDQTRVTYIFEYKVPIAIIGGLLDALVFKRRWEANSEQALQNLKRLIEGQTA